jgi:lysozyme
MRKVPQWVWLLAGGALALWLWRRYTDSAASRLPDESVQPQLLPGQPEPVAPIPQDNVMPQPQQSTYDFIAAQELFSATPYPDADGFSIGYGHFMGSTPTMGSITQTEAVQLLAQDTAIAAQAVNDNVQVALTQNQYDALVDFAYNTGVGAFKSSTLLRKLNAGDYSGAAAEFKRWIYSRGVMLNALIKRRQKETALFLTP